MIDNYDDHSYIKFYLNHNVFDGKEWNDYHSDNHIMRIKIIAIGTYVMYVISFYFDI